MCGIAGYFGFNPPSPDRITQTLRTLRRRGPDGQGQAAWTRDGRTTVLLHTRLAIVDLDERSNQPFTIGQKTIVYNGELYNYKEIRRELEGTGWRFRTTSDTEVLLAAWEAWGEAALERFEGMWAFALYDGADGSLTLCRDRFGQKPLYLVEDDHGLWFASEAKAIFSLRGAGLPVNREHICRYLVNGYKALYKGSQTFFEGLSDLPRASVLRLTADGQRSSRAYWTPSFAPDETMTFERAVEETRALMIDSVRLHLRSDVPIAFCMSGGMDSNALIAIAKKELGYDVHGFTVMIDDPHYNEQITVRDVVNTLGLKHTPVHLSPETGIAGLTDLVRQHDAPVYTITYYMHWRLMAHVAEEGYKISISGTGADELFSGYYDHYLMYLRSVYGTPLFDPAVAAWERHVQPVVRNPFLKDPLRFVRQPEFRDHIFLKNDVFRKALKRPFTEEFYEQTYTSDSLLRNRMMNEMFNEGVPVILHEDDVNAMYFSIENRSPFLNRDLFNLCQTMPDKILMRDGYNKAVLREAMRGIVPDAVVNQRQKYGFNGPADSFVDTRDPQTRASLLADSPIYDLISRDAIRTLLEQDGFENSDSKFLFYFINAKIFLETYSS